MNDLTSLEVHAHAKVNLSLRILAREPSGFHQLETVFCLLELADAVRVERQPTEGVTLDVAGPDLGPHDDNLAVRAASAALATLGHPFGVHITLTKRIPAGAGLGGGSSDAAATLDAVNRLGGGVIPHAELMNLGRELGSDVPFFLSRAGLALAWSRGERMFRLPPLPPRPFLVVVPSESVSTPDAYGWWDDANPDGRSRGPVVLDADVFGSWGSAARVGANDFESVLFGRFPTIRDVFEKLTLTGPLLCRVTGSGSAVFAVYRSETDRDDAALQLGSAMGSVINTTNLPFAAS